jgi:hypothetical protein
MPGKPKPKAGLIATRGAEYIDLTSVEELTGKRPEQLPGEFKSLPGEGLPERLGWYRVKPEYLGPHQRGWYGGDLIIFNDARMAKRSPDGERAKILAFKQKDHPAIHYCRDGRHTIYCHRVLYFAANDLTDTGEGLVIHIDPTNLRTNSAAGNLYLDTDKPNKSPRLEKGVNLGGDENSTSSWQDRPWNVVRLVRTASCV